LTFIIDLSKFVFILRSFFDLHSFSDEGSEVGLPSHYNLTMLWERMYKRKTLTHSLQNIITHYQLAMQNLLWG